MNAEILEKINEQVLSLMSKHGKDWVKPWANHMPQNAITKREYHGINTFILALSNPCPQWATYNAWKTAGAQVRAGETSTKILFWKFLKKDNPQDPKHPDTIPLLKTYSVFNASQVDNWTPPAASNQIIEPDEKINQMIKDHQIKINYGAGKAYYSPSTDEITLPNPGDFISPSDFESTRLHEIAHWTGHTSRLNRLDESPFGSENYALEELTAELAAVYLSMHYGTTPTPNENAAAYLNNWKERIKDNKWTFYQTAKKASQAYEYLTRQDQETEEITQ